MTKDRTLTLDRIQAHLDQLTKPPGSLGRLEDLASRLCLVQQTLAPRCEPRAAVLFAGDHGVVAAGVTAWPSEVTGLMIENIAQGGAACCALAASSRTTLRLVDVGACSPATEQREHVRVARVGAGTKNLALEAAMGVDEFEEALEIGREEARGCHATGALVVCAGEMGIGNTTPAACLAALLMDLDAADACGRGAGSDDETLGRKQVVVGAAVDRARALLQQDEGAAMASVCGFEIAAMAGFYLEAAALGLTVVIDGMITTAAALVAQRLQPGCVANFIGSHRSAEPAHGAMLEQLGIEPFLEWNLRLGEGTGALLLMPMLDAAAAMVRDMATFESAGIRKG